MTGKRIRQKGKISLSKYFKKINENETVCIVRDFGFVASFPKRIVGMSGKIIGTRGMFKLVKISDGGKEKIFIIHPVHLRKLKS